MSETEETLVNIDRDSLDADFDEIDPLSVYNVPCFEQEAGTSQDFHSNEGNDMEDVKPNNIKVKKKMYEIQNNTNECFDEKPVQATSGDFYNSFCSFIKTESDRSVTPHITNSPQLITS